MFANKRNTKLVTLSKGLYVHNLLKEKEKQYFNRVILTRQRYETKIAVSKKEGHEEAIYVVTNGKVEDGIGY